jgi:hypothetical protein
MLNVEEGIISSDENLHNESEAQDQGGGNLQKDSTGQMDTSGSSDAMEPVDPNLTMKEIISEVQVQGGDNSEKDSNEPMDKGRSSYVIEPADPNQTMKKIISEEPVFDGTEVPAIEESRRSSNQSVELDADAQVSVINERAAAIKNFVKEKGATVSTFIWRLSGKKDETDFSIEHDKNDGSECIDSEKAGADAEVKPEVQKKTEERNTWNSLNLIKLGRDFDAFITGEAEHEDVCGLLEQPAMKGRIILYTKLGCEDCKMVRLFLHQKRLSYVEININIFLSRKLELGHPLYQKCTSMIC